MCCVCSGCNILCSYCKLTVIGKGLFFYNKTIKRWLQIMMQPKYSAIFCWISKGARCAKPQWKIIWKAWWKYGIYKWINLKDITASSSSHTELTFSFLHWSGSEWMWFIYAQSFSIALLFNFIHTWSVPVQPSLKTFCNITLNSLHFHSSVYVNSKCA